jgi:hypothetical protein
MTLIARLFRRSPAPVLEPPVVGGGGRWIETADGPRWVIFNYPGFRTQLRRGADGREHVYYEQETPRGNR